MKTAIVLLLLIVCLSFGCAGVQVGGTKEPIKVDVTMRLDIYQHIEKDIDAIESIVSGSAKDSPADKQSLLGFCCRNAYAEEGLSPEVEAAAYRRKDRLSDLASWEAKGVIGENRKGLVEIRNAGEADGEAEQIVSGENSDRMVIYQSVAKKNGSSLEEVEKLYAKRLQGNAPRGTPIEVLNDVGGSYEWETK